MSLPAPLRLALPALPLLAIALGGATDRSTQAVVLVILGVLLLWRPPAGRQGALDGVAAGLVALALAPLALPARWFPTAGWRTALTDDLGIPLPGMLSPQPWLTAEGVALLLAGLGWLFWTLDAAGAMSGRERRALARPFVLGAMGLTLAAIVCYRLGRTPPGWRPERGFGPFPNRNQWANFLALSALLALACSHADFRSGERGRRWRAGLWVAALATLAYAIFLNFSRAGVAILFGGASVYLALAAARTWGDERGAGGNGRQAPTAAPPLAPRLALAVSAVALLLAGFLVFGGATLERFQPAAGGGVVAAVKGDFRWRVQADALVMARAMPWCGAGLGNFGAVFPFFRDRSAITAARAIHPESDWLWMCTEMGWSAGLLAAAGLALLLTRLRRERGRQTNGDERRLRPVRLAALVGVAAFLAHSFVEVSTHRLGTGLAAGFVFALALPSAKLPARSPARALGFRLLGAGLLAVGICWLAAAWAGAAWLPGTLAAANLRRAAEAAAGRGDFAGSAERFSRALRSRPLDWQLYLSRALAELHQPGAADAALADFRRARELEPLSPEPVALETAGWLGEGRHPDFALAALEETFRRDPARGEQAFRRIVTRTRETDADLRRGLEALAWRQPALQLAFLDELRPEDARPRLAALVGADPELTRFADDPARLRRLLWLWAQRGDAPALAAAMERRPAWQALAWRAWAEGLAVAGNFERACAVASRFAAPPTLPPGLTGKPTPVSNEANVDTLGQAFAFSPGDLALGLRLYRAQRAAGQAADARATLAQLGSRPGCPAYVFYLEAQARAEAGDWERAWRAWGRYLQAGKQGE